MFKKIIAGLLLIPALTLAGLPPTTVKDSGDSTDITTFKFRFPNFTGSHSGIIYTLGVNSAAGGGTGQSSYTIGDLLYASSSSALSKLGIGGANQVLTVVGGVPTWQNASTGFTNPMTTLGDIIYGGLVGSATRLAGDTTNANKYLRSLSVAGVATAPSWTSLAAGDITTGQLATARGGTGQDFSGSTGAISVSSGTMSAGTLSVANGGTSLATLTANNVILGNGTSAPSFVAPGTNGNVLTSNGTTWTSAASAGSSLTVGTSPITSGTASRMLFEGAGNVLSEDADLFFDTSNNRLNVPAVTSSATSGANLTLTSTSNATKGSIILDDQQSWWPNRPAVPTSGTTSDVSFAPNMNFNWGAAGASYAQLNMSPTMSLTGNVAGIGSHTGILMNPNVTFNSGLAYIYNGLAHTGTFTSAGNPSFAFTFNMFTGAPTMITATPATSLMSITSMYNAAPTFTVTNVAATTGLFDHGFNHSSIYNVNGPSGSLTATETVGGDDMLTLNTNNAAGVLTMPLRVGFRVKQAAFTATGVTTLTNNYGYKFEDQLHTSGTRVSTNIRALSLEQSSGASNAFNIHASGTAPNVMVGATRIGDTTVATQKFEVLGNQLIDNSGTAGELRFREPSASGSNYSGFKAGIQAFDLIYTLPTTAPTAGQVLSAAAPSGNVSQTSWSTAGSANPTPICFGDTSMTGTAASAALNGVSNSPLNRYIVPYAAHIVYMSCDAQAARTAGTATFEAFVNGSLISGGNTCILNATNTAAFSVSANIALSTNDAIQGKVTTSGWTPTASDDQFCIWITRD